MSEDIATGEDLQDESAADFSDDELENEFDDDLDDDEFDEDGDDDKTVPLKVVKKIRRELKDQKTANQNLQNQFNVYLANMQNPNRQAEPVADDDDDEIVMSRSDVKKLIAQHTAPLLQQIQETRLISKDADSENLVRKYIPKLIQREPEYQEILRTLHATNPGQAMTLAYKLAKKEAARRTNKQTSSDNVDKIIKNSKKPGNVTGGKPSSVQGADFWEQASDDEVRAQMNEILGRG